MTTALTYEPNSNRSEMIGSSPVSLDPSGRVVVDEQGRTYQYNQAGRLATLRQKGQVVGEYEYNAKQLRRLKRVNGVETVFYYDLTGNLLAESDETGAVIKEYVYVEGERIAMFVQASYQTDRNKEEKSKEKTKKQKAGIQAEQVHYYVNDHLGTPQRLVNSIGTVSWQANYEAFGKAIITTETITQNHRFPGQYFDEESNLHYNWNRYYEPQTGRYITSDPIGLEGGANTYRYAKANPVNYFDPTGKVAIAAPWVIPPLASGLGQLCTIVAGAGIVSSISGSASGNQSCEDDELLCEEDKCPPCKTISGRIIPVKTLGYRPLDNIPDDEMQHGVYGPHHNIFEANQIPFPNCDCFWAKQNYVLKPDQLSGSMVPVESFAN